jgi:RNase P subunit RPR2
MVCDSYSEARRNKQYELKGEEEVRMDVAQIDENCFSCREPLLVGKANSEIHLHALQAPVVVTTCDCGALNRHLLGSQVDTAWQSKCRKLWMGDYALLSDIDAYRQATGCEPLCSDHPLSMADVALLARLEAERFTRDGELDNDLRLLTGLEPTGPLQVIMGGFRKWIAGVMPTDFSQSPDAA